MRRISIGLILMLLAAPAAAQTREENVAQCASNDLDIKIGGCTALIQSGQGSTEVLGQAYANRGLAYERKGYLVQAISDYRAALRINPDDYAANLGLARLNATQ
ncbi:MAG TPA: tetratricopeptide repeat protein [Stellaceae bacterium]|jgi:tetratricopeptide (TPR) repeat protein|nr:tetratricopeptide repeat protein [Stellaceae bacterium]